MGILNDTLMEALTKIESKSTKNNVQKIKNKSKLNCWFGCFGSCTGECKDDCWYGCMGMCAYDSPCSGSCAVDCSFECSGYCIPPHCGLCFKED